MATRRRRMRKSSPELVTLFERLLPARGIERRSMFGCPAAFVGGNMFAGLVEDRLVLRLDEASAAEAKAGGATDFEPQPGRRMRGWVTLGAKAVADERSARSWVARARAHASALPVKPRRRSA